ncbi:MAG: hypothetical protein R3Y24_00825 [Eubacteriales bacterium]
MWKIFKKNITFLFLCGFLIIILINSQIAIAFASNGLYLWFQNMIPTLFPFMILSAVLLRTNLSYKVAALLKPILFPVYRLSNDCIYCMVIGFLCGFPMGAKIIAESYHLHKISKKEAQLLLAFCNNIGPTFILGFIIPLFQIKEISLVFFTMYGIPLLYGFLLRYTKFRDLKDDHSLEIIDTSETILDAFDYAIHSSIQAITTLGGYMIFFNLLMIFPYLSQVISLACKGEIADVVGGNLFSPFVREKIPETLYAISCCLTEITGGANILATLDLDYKIILILLHFGGLSCIAQTYTMINSTNLSIREYASHKIIQSVIVALFLYLIN